MEIEIFNGFWTESDVISNPEKIFIFGDNDQRAGKGGQAIIRDQPNTFGIRTKKYPSNDPDSFYTDDEFAENCRKIREDILSIRQRFFDKTIVLSSGGYGTGLSKLPQMAPVTFQFLNEHLKWNFKFDNVTGKKWQRIPSHFDVITAKPIHIKSQINQDWFDYSDPFKCGSLVSFDLGGHSIICRVITDSFLVGGSWRFYFEGVCEKWSNGEIKYGDFLFGKLAQ